MAKYIVVVPERDVVIVYQNHAESPDDTSKLSAEEYAKLPAPAGDQVERLLNMILRARQ
jgi:hypothetical protein